jgi:NNP family nitrate/nitrite transporter-like MFS transporter
MADIKTWNTEDPQFWESTGKSIANRNLWISIPSLLCGFAVWLYWGIITVQMLNLGFPFAKAELFTLAAIAGLTGATLRIPSSFFIRIAGGRNTIFFTTAMLMIPAIGTGFALQASRSWPSCPASVAATSPPPCPTSVSSSRNGCRVWRWG